MYKYLAVLIYFVCPEIAYSQLPVLGRCPDVKVMDHFDPTQYSGRWYEIEKYFAVFQIGGICVTADYTDLGNGSLRVWNRQVQSISGQVRSFEGRANMKDSKGRGKLGVTFPSIPVTAEAPYWVLDTDYSKYAIVWSCNDFGIGFMSFRILWYLARERHPSEDVRELVYAKLKELQIPSAPLQKTYQEGCAEPITGS